MERVGDDVQILILNIIVGVVSYKVLGIIGPISVVGSFLIGTVINYMFDRRGNSP